MSQFEIEQFESRVDALIAAHEKLRLENHSLREAYDAARQRNAETRERLNGVIERIRALEAEADNA